MAKKTEKKLNALDMFNQVATIKKPKKPENIKKEDTVEKVDLEDKVNKKDSIDRPEKIAKLEEPNEAVLNNKADSENGTEKREKQLRAISLVPELDRKFRIGARRNRLTLEDFFYDIYEASRNNPDLLNGEDLYIFAHKKYSDKKEKTTIYISDEQYESIGNSAHDSGLNITEYMNYIVEFYFSHAE